VFTVSDVQHQPGRDDMLLHPAVRAVMVYCTAAEPQQAG